MSVEHEDIFAALAEPFPPGQVKTREGAGGRQLSYITARQAMIRLDEVVGPGNWSDRFYEVCNVLFCEITLRLPDGRTVSKADAGGFKQMTEKGQVDEENTDKTGASDAFKRAAAKLGIARELYRDGVAGFVREHYGEPAATRQPQQQRRPAPPSDVNGHGERERHEWGTAHRGPSQPAKDYGPPKTGRHLWAWCCRQKEETGVDIGKWLQNWAKLQDIHGKLVEWSEGDVATAYAEAARKLSTEAYDEALAN